MKLPEIAQLAHNFSNISYMGALQRPFERTKFLLHKIPVVLNGEGESHISETQILKMETKLWDAGLKNASLRRY